MLTDEWQQIVVALGTTIREVRTLLGWTQQHLADQAVVSQGTISRLERGGCAAVPFHSVIVVLRTLAAGATAMHVPVSPAAAQLLAFATVDGSFRAITPPDPPLAEIARTLARIHGSRRPAFLAIVRAAAAAFDAAEPAPSTDGPIEYVV